MNNYTLMVSYDTTFYHTLIKKLLNLLLSIFLLCGACQGWTKSPIRITVTGINDPVRKNVINRLNLAADKLGKQPSATQVTSFFNQSQQHIIIAMQAYGYFEPRIRRSISQKPKYSHMNFVIQAGKPVRVGSIQFIITGHGNKLARLRAYRQQLPLKPGDVLVSERYEKIKTDTIDIAQAEGYIDARWQLSQIKVHPQKHTATIVLQLNTGPRYYFGQIRFNETKLSDAFLRRYLTFKQGDAFSAKKLLQLEDNLRHSNYFESVIIHTKTQNTHNRMIPIKINLTMKNRQAYHIGAGYGTNSHLRGSLGMELRYIGNTGHHFEAEIAASAINRKLHARYTIPGLQPLNEHYAISATLFQQDSNSTVSDGFQLSGAYISTFDEWHNEYALSALYTKNKNRGFKNTRSKVLYPNFSWRLMHGTHEMNKDWAYALDIKLLGSIDNVFANVSFIQLHSKFKWIAPIFDGTRFINRISLAYNSTRDQKLPGPLRLYAGGTESIRGYDFQEFPVIGVARYLISGSVELQQRIWGEWYVATYFDVGNAVVKSPFKLNRSIGLGVVRNTPIGIIHIGAAKLLDGHRRPIRFVFSVGPDL